MGAPPRTLTIPYQRGMTSGHGIQINIYSVFPSTVVYVHDYTYYRGTRILEGGMPPIKTVFSEGGRGS